MSQTADKRAKISKSEPVDPPFDFRRPNYATVFIARMRRLEWIRQNPECIPDLRAFYKENIADLISDWGVTFDPRLVERGLPGMVPFVLFQRQREYVDWVVDHWRRQIPGLCEKSRDCGVSWLNMGIACAMCLTYDGMVVGLGSRKSEYVDKIGNMKALIPKGRMFMQNMPREFSAGFRIERDAPHMAMYFPETGSAIGGEGGDDIGRGDRASIYFVDESAYLERAELVEASLSQTTNCRIDVSSVKNNTVFATKRFSGLIDVFIFDWRDDPRKDEEWYRLLSAPASEGGKGLDPVTIAQEVDRDYAASVTGVVIPSIWVRAAIDACAKLGISPSGHKASALDVADEGADKNAMCGVTGVEIDFLRQWSGKGSDIAETAQTAVNICDEMGYHGYRYDADGLGAGIRGDMRVINEKRVSLGARAHQVDGFRGSEAVHDPDGIVEGTMSIDGTDTGRTNKDYFANRKAQGWWSIRRRFYLTYQWVEKGIKCHPDAIISISSKCALYQTLVTELSQPTYKMNEVGKMIINKKPNNMPSPNLADSAMIRFAPNDVSPLLVTPELLAMARRMPPRRNRY